MILVKKCRFSAKKLGAMRKKLLTSRFQKLRKIAQIVCLPKKIILGHIILLKYPQFFFKPVAPFFTECLPLKVYSQKHLVKAVQTKISKSKRDASCTIHVC